MLSVLYSMEPKIVSDIKALNLKWISKEFAICKTLTSHQIIFAIDNNYNDFNSA